MQAARRETAAARRADAAVGKSAAIGARIELIRPGSAREWGAARRLIEAYAGSLGVDLSFQNIDHELEHLAEEYGPPTGAFFPAVEADLALGCAGLRRFGDGVGEMKRLYTVPAARGRGAGRLLAEAVMAEARRLGYERLVLDTLPSMKEARALYASLGFTPTAAYRFNPVPGTAYLELTLPASR